MSTLREAACRQDSKSSGAPAEGEAAPRAFTRREVATALAAAFGGTALGGCDAPPSAHSLAPDDTGASALSPAYALGQQVLYAATIEGDLRNYPNPSSTHGVAVAAGFRTDGDGGGGVFVWDTKAPLPRDDGGTIIMPNNQTTGVWRRLYSGHLNVKWFGAHGDGDPNKADHLAIQKAIDALPTGVFGGGTVFLPGGTYAVGASIRVPSGVTICGVGPQQSRVTVGVGVTAFTVAGATRVTFRDMMVDAARAVGSTAFSIIYGSSQVTLNNLWIESIDTGVRVNDSYFLHFEQVRIMSARSYSFRLERASNSISMINVAIMSGETSHKAIEWYQSSALGIYSCAFEGYSPIHSFDTSGLTIHGCYFENNGPAPTRSAWLYLGNGNGYSVRGVQISGSLFNGGAEYGIWIAATSGVVIEGNHFATNLGAIRVYHYDNSPKQQVMVGMNSYNIAERGYDASKILIDEGTPQEPTSLGFPGTRVYRERAMFNAPAAPTMGSFTIGDIVWNSTPRSGTALGWVYTVDGWREMTRLI